MTTPPQSPVDHGDPATDRPGTDRPAPRDPAARPPIDVWWVLRALVVLAGLASLALWGYYSWPFPSPALWFMVGAPAFAAVVWALFRSPRSPITTDPVGKVIVEVALVVAAAAAWLSIGHPVVGLVFLVVAAVSGIVTFRREPVA